MRFTKFFADFIKNFGKAQINRLGAIPTIKVGTARKEKERKEEKRKIKEVLMWFAKPL